MFFFYKKHKVLSQIKEFQLMVPKFLSPSEKKILNSFISIIFVDFSLIFPEEQGFLQEIKDFYLKN